MKSAPASEMAEWVEAGRRDPKSVYILFHAQNTHAAGGAEADCPFADRHGKARKQWLWMFRICVKAAKAQADDGAAAGADPVDKAECWRHRADM